MITQQAQLVVTDADLAKLREMTRALRTSQHPFRQYAGDLEAELGRARVVPQADVPPDVVTMNSTVRIRDRRSREPEEFTLVYPADSDALDGRISVLAPLGLAVLGARAGDVIKWQVPAGVRTFTVEAILYQPEAAGDFHL
jgi:regulator of nucleoside diphosphate kinase